MADNANIPLTPLEFKDFSGGMTDYPEKCARNQYEIAENFDVDYDRLLTQRKGFVLYDSSNIYRTINLSRLDSIFEIPNTNYHLFGANGVLYQDAYPGSQMYYVPAADVNTTTTNIFTAASNFSYALHNRHTSVCTDQMDLPAKIYIQTACNIP